MMQMQMIPCNFQSLHFQRPSKLQFYFAVNEDRRLANTCFNGRWPFKLKLHFFVVDCCGLQQIEQVEFELYLLCFLYAGTVASVCIVAYW